jgi:hypothetical protein
VLPIAAAFLLLSAHAAPAGVLFESATLGRTGIANGGYSVGALQFLGVAFTLSRAAKISAIGGHISSEGSLFAAVVRLPSGTAVPSFAPADLPANVVAHVVFKAPEKSGDFIVPVSVTLPPGAYGLMFGSGMFGAEGSGFMPVPTDTGAADIPGTVNYFSYTAGAGGSSSRKWESGRFRGARFVVHGEPASSPSPTTGSRP